MIQKPALLISIGLTAFIVFMLSGLLTAFAAGNNPAGSQSADASAAIQVSPDVAQLIADREAAYIELINQANQRLFQAEGGSMTTNVSDPLNPLSSSVSVEQATELALGSALAGSQITGEAQLVNFEGIVAYEVPFDRGNIYIDAATGELVFNGTISLQPSPITQEQAAQIAANYLGRTDIYRIELDQLNGAEVFRVKFLNGDAVFVDPFGQILLVRLAATGGTSTSSNSGENEHEDDDDEDDDD